jgi:hypothetical protein
MSSTLRLILAFVLILAAGSRVVEVVGLRAELGALRADRTASELRLEELRGLRETIARDPALAQAIAERWVRGELLLP